MIFETNEETFLTKKSFCEEKFLRKRMASIRKRHSPGRNKMLVRSLEMEQQENKLKQWVKSKPSLYRAAKKVWFLKPAVLKQYWVNYPWFWMGSLMRRMGIPAAKRPYEKLESYKGKYQGKRCFVIGTGPSLRVEDLERLSGEYTFGMNSLLRLYSKTDWRPVFYFVGDFDLFAPGEAFYRKKLENVCEKQLFLSHPIRKMQAADDAAYVPVSWLDHRVNYGSLSFRYEPDLVGYGIYDAYTIANYTIELAAYMGFTEIYLLGIDCNYSGPVKHAGETEEDEKKNTKEDYQKTEYCMMKSYEYIKSVMDSRGIHVYNASRGGKLKVFPQVDLDQVINHKDYDE